MIEIENLTFKYNNSQATSIVNIPSWEVKDNDRIFISGPSGSGKSTLLHLLSGLLEPTSGSIFINRTNINHLSSKKKNQFRANHIGLISQQFNLIPYLSILENIELASSFQSKHSNNLINEISLGMENLNLDKQFLHRKASDLSIGQQQRVAIIRALINKPKLLLADEPTSALDEGAKQSFIKTLKEICDEQKITLILISHDFSLKTNFVKTINMEDFNVN